MTALPAVGKERPLKLPSVSETKLRNGLRIVAARKPGVSRAEIRLLVPAGAAADSRSHGARAWLAAQSLTAGTAGRTSLDIARDLQRMGAELGGQPGMDRMWLSGAVLARDLRPFLELVAEVLTESNAPQGELEVARSRLAHSLRARRASPGFAAMEALAGRIYGSHPYASLAPGVDEIEATGRSPVLTFLRDNALPRGSTLVLVGDVPARSAVSAAERALSGWKAAGGVAGSHRDVPPPKPGPPGDILVVHRPGSVQTTIAAATSVPRRTDPGYFAVLMANTIFGGAFASRLSRNVREDKGYTYDAGTGFGEYRGANLLQMRMNVRTEVTGAALNEIRYELGRMCTTDVTSEELDGARRYLLGTQALALCSQSSMATALGRLEELGVGPGYLKVLRDKLAAVTAADVADASRKYMAPRLWQTVLLGDRTGIERQIEPLR